MIKILLDVKGKVVLIEEVMCIPFPSRNMFETLQIGIIAKGLVIFA